ncbi:MAG: SpoIIE family protein phosphatase [Isosphaeraceae bacterium]|nr:SpoIIE family protein phosphatase [Isosphaeraceae bacterium]
MSAESSSLLVVDDNEMSRDLLSRRLRLRGYEVAVACDGKEALALLRSRRFDLVVLDVMMPILNGFQVLEIIRKEHPASELPVIMATALDQSEDIIQALKLGANDYVAKPLDFPVVAARIQTHLALKRAMDEVLRLQGQLAERNRRLEEANARLRRDLRAAARVQGTFLPRAVPPVGGAACAWVFRPCEELAGDGLSIFALGPRHLGLYVLDVSGHGVASALLSAAIARALVPPPDPASILAGPEGEPTSPAAVASELDRLFPFDMETEQYFTLLYGVLDVASGAFTYVSAGHPGPIVVPGEGEPRGLEAGGFPIGLAEGPYEDRSARLAPGDRLVLYSDGVTEAVSPDGRAFGVGRMLEVLRRGRAAPLGESLAALRQEVEGWCGDGGPSDDISLLAVELVPRPADADASRIS